MCEEYQTFGPGGPTAVPYMERVVRECNYHVALDLTHIEYLRSAGILGLVMQYTNLQALNGMS